MTETYQARWISKPRANAIRKEIRARGSVLLTAFNGMIIVEPKGADLGDGKILAPGEADYELQPVWCIEPKAKLEQARKLLGLEDTHAPELQASALAG
jgi:hypothetical protein